MMGLIVLAILGLMAMMFCISQLTIDLNKIVELKKYIKEVK